MTVDCQEFYMPFEPGDLKAEFDAVANYHLDDKLHPHLQLARVEQVLDQLAGAGKAALFLSDIAEQAGEGWQRDERAKTAVEVLTGKHETGFQLTIVEAAHEGGVVYIPVLADAERSKILAVGNVDAENAYAHPDLTYVNATDKKADDEVTMFIEEGLRFRNKRHDREDGMESVAPAMMYALTALTGRGFVAEGKKPDIAGALTAIANDPSGVAAFSVAAQRLADGSYAQKLDPVRFRDGTEEAFSMKGGSLSLENSKRNGPK
jgi:hypothetical protein